MRRLWMTGVLAALSTGSMTARAASATAPAANGQAALTVEVTSAGVKANGGALEVPEAAKRLLANAKVNVVELEAGRRVVHVIGSDASGVSYEALVAGALAGQNAPVVLFSGMTGGVQGESGEDKTGAIGVEASPRGARIVVGERHQDQTICGRPAIVASHALDPATLTLTKFASFQSLSEKERASAKAIAATPVATPTLLPLRLLRTKLASSAVERSLGALTDANLETSWSEASVGDGRGDFVSFDAAAEVPINALEIVVRPGGGADVPHGTSPRSLYIATDDKLFKITLPEDGFRKPGAAFNIAFAEPLQTSCLAVVLDDSFAAKGDKDARTTLTEVTAKTAYDGMDVAALVGALAGGGPRARGAGAILERGGRAAAEAAIAAYPKLDDLGKELARRVVDGGPCSVRGPFYEKRFEETAARGRSKGASPGEIDPDYAHAVHVLTTACKSDGATAFAKLLGASDAKVRLAAAEQLALLSPSQAVGALLDALATADAASRGDLIRALANAARSTRARLAVARELEAEKFAARSEPVRIALLRAVGPELAHVEGGPQAFAGLATPSAPFSTRYLLQAPAAELAKGGDAKAQAFLEASLAKDGDPHIRTRAAEVSAQVPTVLALLIHAVDDPEVRVREAAINALAETKGAGIVAPIGRRLASDDWTFVRAAAARALGAQPAGAEVDQALANALDDAAPDVRGRAASSLGDHHATQHASAVRKLAAKEGELVEVRAHAVAALGELCDTASLDMLTKLAQRSTQAFDDVGRALGPPAIEALGAIHPADLDARLGPLLAKSVTGPVKEMAQSAKRGKGSCGK